MSLVQDLRKTLTEAEAVTTPPTEVPADAGNTAAPHEPGNIVISKSASADTRSVPDPSAISKEILLQSSHQHIGDVAQALRFFAERLEKAAKEHDADKITGIDHFHQCFITGFKDKSWWENHQRINRHHLAKPPGVPADVNLVDVIEYISDCVMAGMARTGKVYDIEFPGDLLQRAANNTVNLLKASVTVKDGESES